MPIQNQTALVKRIKDELIAKGQTFKTNCDAFEITGRVAWALRDQGARLIVKTPGQNGCTWTNGVRYSHDAIAFSDGWVDCLESAGPPLNTNGPTWGWTAVPPTGPLAEPFNLEHPVPDVHTPVPDVHTYVGGDNDTGICDECGRPRTDPVHAIPIPIRSFRHAGSESPGARGKGAGARSTSAGARGCISQIRAIDCLANGQRSSDLRGRWWRQRGQRHSRDHRTLGDVPR